MPQPFHDRTVVPVIEEKVEIDRHLVDTAEVHVRKHVSEHTEQVSPMTRRETISVEHVPVNRYVESPPGTRMEGDVLVVPVLEEVVVVEKRLLLREEVHIRKTFVEERGAPQDVVLRREDVEVERVPIYERPDEEPD